MIFALHSYLYEICNLVNGPRFDPGCIHLFDFLAVFNTSMGMMNDVVKRVFIYIFLGHVFAPLIRINNRKGVGQGPCVLPILTLTLPQPTQSWDSRDLKQHNLLFLVK